VHREHAPIAFWIFLLINQSKKTKIPSIGMELKKKCEKMKKSFGIWLIFYWIDGKNIYFIVFLKIKR
jgi:hypothetical protein